MGAEIIFEQAISINERFRVDLRVLMVKQSKRFPDGIKARYVLVDIIDKVPRLLVDNHQPYGFHIHTGLPSNRSLRSQLENYDYKQAREEFWKRTWEIINETKTT